jgi:hydrogenase maturation protein HypF
MARRQPVTRKRLLITGQVQGVGFRPFVYRLATELNLTGWVLNDARGVTIEVQGLPAAACGFEQRLRRELPPLAEVATCQVADAEPMAGEKHFEIRPSAGGELTDAQVTVDTATCDDCLREMSSPDDPRYRYPFINCTNCGPRYTIVKRIPYDRPNTTMADFGMCLFCARQYTNPADRRFHAEPVACPECGPHVWLVDPRGQQLYVRDAIRGAADMLMDRRIVALKGLGGFHLACRADDEETVRRLRRRKRRDAKPFALMVRDLAQARELCVITPEAEALLTGPLRPIVLLPRRDHHAPAGVCRVAPSVAQGLKTLGVMLPYTPVHHLLFRHVDRPLVMTSANYAEEPLVKDNEEAIEQLGALADALLLHNRHIERRLDDSVVQLAAPGRLSVIRRARGYAPQPVRIASPTAIDAEVPAQGIRSPQCCSAKQGFAAKHESAIRNGPPAILAVGAELKNAVCLYRDGRALLGEHIGDLKDGRTYRHFIDTVRHLEDLFEVEPEVIAADKHPQYLSTEYALRRCRGELPGRPAARLIRVQHHHAHAVACLAENGRAEAIALVCDGVGYGDDGAVWGCEVLRASLAAYERLGHLRYCRLPGADRAALETYRPAVAALHDAFGDDCLDHPVAARLAAGRAGLKDTLRLLQTGVNCPASSSLGRWFDAVAALCGVAEANRFEGQAPMALESAVAAGVDGAYGFRLESDAPFQIDLRPMVAALADDLVGGERVGVVAAKFHNTVASFLLAAARRAREQTRLHVVALSGGCFVNRYLMARLLRLLEADGFAVLTHRTIPTNDGGVALGQAVVAAATVAAAHEAQAP